MSRKKIQGFSLAELSIVLIIVSLLVAGVSGGSRLIEQTKLRSVISEVDEYKTALRTFKGIYGYLPGDMPNADSYWPSCVVDASHTYNVCNGNADDKLTFFGGTLAQLKVTVRGNIYLSLA